MTLRDLTPMGNGSVAFLGALFLGLGPPLAAQTTYTSYKFTTVAGGFPGYADGTGSAARFDYAYGVAVDGGGDVYVADSGNQAIRKIAAGGVVTTLAVTPGSAGVSARFSDPMGVAVDAGGNLYVADAGSNTIDEIAPGGAMTILAGTPGVKGSADGTGPAAQFDGPSGVAVDASGNVYVCDTGNNTVRKIAAGGVVTTLAGTPGTRGSADGAGPAAQFSSPDGIAVDGGGNVYVADTNNSTIRRITAAGAVTTLAGAAGVAGSEDGPGSEAQFLVPYGVAVDSAGNVYVADTYNSTIRRIDAAGTVTTLAGIPRLWGGGDGTGPAAQFESPVAVAVDGHGNVYVSDLYNFSIRAGSAAVQAAATVTLGNLVQGYDGTPKSPTVTTNPAGLATIVVYEYSPSPSTSPPSNTGGYPVFATIVDPAYTGSSYATFTVAPSLPPDSSMTVRNTQAGGSFLWGIASGPSGLVAVGTGGTILGSRDGATWTQRSSGTANWLTAVAYGGGQYIAVGDNGCVLLSADAASWTSVAQSATTERLNNVIFAVSEYVAVGEGGTIITSPDGRQWTARTSGVTGWLRGLAYVGRYNYTYGLGTSISGGFVPARFVASGQAGAIISSTDGVTWASEASSYGSGSGSWGSGEDLEALITTQSVNFTAVGADGTSFTTSWGSALGHLGGLYPPVEYLEGYAIPLPLDFRGLVLGSNAVFATGESGSIEAASASTNGSLGFGPWEQLASGTAVDLVGAAAIGDSVFFVGDNETILELAAPYDSRLVNLSCRAQVGTGANALITGFVVGGQGAAGTEPLLIRGSGPALVPFGVSGTLPDPELQLNSTAPGGGLLAANTGWGGASAISGEAAAVGAFPWPSPSSHDAALIANLGSGPYTANLFGEAGDTGVALTEVYDVTPAGTVGPSSPRLINLSARSQVGSGGSILIAGFVIGGSTPKTVLVRASGPALVPFGLSGTLVDPKLAVYGSAPGSTPLVTNTGWGANQEIETAAAWVGAFSWGSASTPDAAILVTLPPGAYTAQVSGASGDGGIALVEVYEVE
ncbi:MAG: MBG domain-containing protein [Opitutaceae bacterium]